MYEKLQEWFNKNKPDENLIYKGGLWPQVKMFRDTIPSILARSQEEFRGIRDGVMVISTHTSKSVTLPVFELTWNDFRFIARYNFYDWKLSVRAPVGVELSIDFLGLFKDKKINSVYCEGFRDEWVYWSYEDNQRQFTIELYDNYQLYTFFWILRYHVHGGTHVKKTRTEQQEASITEVPTRKETGDQQAA